MVILTQNPACLVESRSRRPVTCQNLMNQHLQSALGPVNQHGMGTVPTLKGRIQLDDLLPYSRYMKANQVYSDCSNLELKP